MTQAEFDRLQELSAFVAGSCEGCGLEHNCTKEGCAVIRAAFLLAKAAGMEQARADMWQSAFKYLAIAYKRATGYNYLPGILGRGLVSIDNDPKTGGGKNGL